jgi:hypothetical protein
VADCHFKIVFFRLPHGMRILRKTALDVRLVLLRCLVELGFHRVSFSGGAMLAAKPIVIVKFSQP